MHNCTQGTGAQSLADNAESDSEGVEPETIRSPSLSHPLGATPGAALPSFSHTFSSFYPFFIPGFLHFAVLNNSRCEFSDREKFTKDAYIIKRQGLLAFKWEAPTQRIMGAERGHSDEKAERATVTSHSPIH